MAISLEDLALIKKEVFAEADNKYVSIEACNTSQTRVNGRFANDDKRIDLIIQKQDYQNSKLSLNNWLTFAVLGAIITLVIGYYFA